MLRVKSLDEQTKDLADVYDGLVAPKRIWRNNNNKIYLILRSMAAGLTGLIDAALALRNRFNPLYCDDLDLYSTAKIVGTEFKAGSGSILRITVVNRDRNVEKLLTSGVYNYLSVSGMIFYFELSNDILFEAEESRVIMAISREKGSFYVGDNATINLFRSDNERIDKAFTFSCEDNQNQLGYEDESAFDFRTRILNDADRQDHIKELELAIRNLPNIFECNLVINEGTELQIYDDIQLKPKELLVTLTGVPTSAVADIICEKVLYDTKMVNEEHVLWYKNPLYINGRRPVYFRYHAFTEFSLDIDYQYDTQILKSSQVEDAINALFKPLTRTVTHQDVFSEGNAYVILESLNLPNIKILDVRLFDSEGSQAPFIRIPKTRLPRLTEIVFTPTELGGII
jgi:hypothetical protein